MNAQGTARVLVVEDDESTRELIDVIFAQEPGIYYSIAAGGANALAKLADGPPDVILTELTMPRVDGGEVVAFARERYPGIPIIGVGSDAAPEEDPRYVRIDGEAVRYVRKPLDLTALVNVVRELASDRSWRPPETSAS